MSNKTYDFLKWAALVLLPALGTLYCALASIWGLALAEQIVGTITAADTFLGVVLGVSSANYKAGQVKRGKNGENDENYEDSDE